MSEILFDTGGNMIVDGGNAMDGNCCTEDCNRTEAITVLCGQFPPEAANYPRPNWPMITSRKMCIRHLVYCNRTRTVDGFITPEVSPTSPDYVIGNIKDPLKNPYPISPDQFNLITKRPVFFDGGLSWSIEFDAVNQEYYIDGGCFDGNEANTIRADSELSVLEDDTATKIIAGTGGNIFFWSDYLSEYILPQMSVDKYHAIIVTVEVYRWRMGQGKLNQDGNKYYGVSGVNLVSTIVVHGPCEGVCVDEDLL